MVADDDDDDDEDDDDEYRWHLYSSLITESGIASGAALRTVDFL
jgi:hypothetical protein